MIGFVVFQYGIEGCFEGIKVSWVGLIGCCYCFFRGGYEFGDFCIEICVVSLNGWSGFCVVSIGVFWKIVIKGNRCCLYCCDCCFFGCGCIIDVIFYYIVVEICGCIY